MSVGSVFLAVLGPIPRGRRMVLTGGASHARMGYAATGRGRASGRVPGRTSARASGCISARTSGRSGVRRRGPWRRTPTWETRGTPTGGRLADPWRTAPCTTAHTDRVLTALRVASQLLCPTPSAMPARAAQLVVPDALFALGSVASDSTRPCRMSWRGEEQLWHRTSEADCTSSDRQARAAQKPRPWSAR
jgi:hypothetical protein